MARMLQDALIAESPDADLLARYVEDRPSLSAEELRQAEAYFDASPAQRDQLKVLESFDLAGVLAEAQADATTVGAHPAEASDNVVPWSRFREGLRARSNWVWAPAALAAAAALFLLFRLPGPSPIVPGASEELEVAIQTTPDTSPETAPSGSGVEVETPAVVAPISPEAVQLAERVAPESPALSSGEERLAEARAWDPLEGSPPPAGVPLTPESETGSESVQLLAMVDPVYAAPPGSSADALFATFRSSPAASSHLPVLVAPDHVGRSASATPALLWKLPATPAEGAALSLVIVAVEGRDALVDQPLSFPTGTDPVRTELGDLGAALEPGVTYSWMVILSPDPDDLGQETIATGLIEFVPPGLGLVERVRASGLGERPALWAAAGYWYDTAAELDALHRQHPQNAGLSRAMQSLLLQGRGAGGETPGTP